MRGRNSIFRDKRSGARVAGVLTAEGKGHFEECRLALWTLYKEVVGREPVAVSDADVIEFLARGGVRTRRYLHTLR